MPENANRLPCHENLYNAMLEGYARFSICRDENDQPCDYRFLAVNRRFEALSGLSASDVIGKTLKQVMYVPDDRWAEIGKSLQAMEEVCQFEWFFEVDNRYFQVSIFLPSDDIVVALFLETTVQKKAEEALEMHRVLFENAQDIILYINTDGRIVDCNYQAQKQYGYTKQQLLTKTIQELRHPSMVVDYRQQMRQAEAVGVLFEGFHVRSDGTPFPVEVSARGVKTAHGPFGSISSGTSQSGGSMRKRSPGSPGTTP